MIISKKDWSNYINRLSALNIVAAKKMEHYIVENPTATIYDLIVYATALINKYGEGSAELACQMYDAIAELQRVQIKPAVPAKVATKSEIARAMIGAGLSSPEQNAGIVGRMVKQAGADTMLQNARRDGAYFAWIPSGDTCAFCMAIASQGWRRASKKTVQGDHAKHIHTNCNCEFIIDFKGGLEIEGYDPDSLREKYDNAEGVKPKDKINYLRRQHYAANKDAINAQKREAYAKNKE